jgi:hypothetical protein
MAAVDKTGRMNDEDVSRLLRELPPDEPSADFTARVLARVGSRPRPRRRVFTLAWAGAALVGILLSQAHVRERYRQSKAAARVEELRGEYRELQAEIEKLRALSRELEPVLELGGTEDVGFVFDLRELARREDGPAARPASHSTMEETRR